jgi:hypothetical protein
MIMGCWSRRGNLRGSCLTLGCGMAVVVRLLEALLGAFLIAGLLAPNEK